MIETRRALSLPQRGLHLIDHIRLDDITGFDVVEVLDRNTAFHTGFDLFRVFFEAFSPRLVFSPSGKVQQVAPEKE